MPDEYRRLRFSMDEVTASVIDYMLRRGDEMPRGHLSEIGFTEDGRQLMLRFRRDGEPPSPTVLLPREAVAAALMRNCLREQIPLPRRAFKSLAIEDGHLCLVLRMDDPRHAA